MPLVPRTRTAAGMRAIVFLLLRFLRGTPTRTPTVAAAMMVAVSRRGAAIVVPPHRRQQRRRLITAAAGGGGKDSWGMEPPWVLLESDHRTSTPPTTSATTRRLWDGDDDDDDNSFGSSTSISISQRNTATAAATNTTTTNSTTNSTPTSVIVSSNSIFQLRIGNLDWTKTIAECEGLLRRALSSSSSSLPIRGVSPPNSSTNHTTTNDDNSPAIPYTMTMTIQFKPPSHRRRDVGKHHAGTVLVTLADYATATAAMQQLQHHPANAAVLGQGGVLRVELLVKNSPAAEKSSSSSILTPERIALRLDRAASYARRRKRVANATDAILTALIRGAAVSTTTSSSSSRVVWWNETATSRAVLQAAELDWSSAPAEIDPARGGGLNPNDDDDEIDDTFSIHNHTKYNSNPAGVFHQSTTINTTITSSHQGLPNRATRKRAAVEAFVVVVRDALVQWDDLPNETKQNEWEIQKSNRRHPTTVVISDLGCGAGNLALPLAWWLRHPTLPNRLSSSSSSSSSSASSSSSSNGTIGGGSRNVKVLGIDINGFALDRLRRRAASVAFESTVVDQEESGSSTTIPHRPLVDTWQQNLLQLLDDGNNNSNSTEKSLNSTMRNLVAESAAVVSLHACGAASDLAIAVAVQRGLPFAISPCCIGKVALPQVQSQTQHQKSFAKFPPLPPLSPIMNQSTAPANPIRYPRSVWLQNQITLDEYHLLAAAADTGGPRNDDNDEKRWRRGRMAKQIVEMDRLQWAREYGYYTRMLELPRIGPVYCKRELLLGALRDSPAAHRIANLAVETRIIE